MITVKILEKLQDFHNCITAIPDATDDDKFIDLFNFCILLHVSIANDRMLELNNNVIGERKYFLPLDESTSTG